MSDLPDRLRRNIDRTTCAEDRDFATDPTCRDHSPGSPWEWCDSCTRLAAADRIAELEAENVEDAMWERCDGVWHHAERPDCPHRVGEPTAILTRKLRSADGFKVCVSCLYPDDNE